MPRPKTRSRRAPRSTERDSYHHGALREALVSATMEMLEEGGEAAVSLREAARRAGVSSGAPFRHFADKRALFVAVAEEANTRMFAAMEAAMSEVDDDDPLEQFRAMGVTYVTWAAEHPALFRLMCAREPDGSPRSPALAAMEQASQARIDALLARARERGQASGPPELVALTAQALTYGLARMLVDGVLEPHGVGRARAREIASAVTGVLGQGLGSPLETPAPAARPAAKREQTARKRSARKAR